MFKNYLKIAWRNLKKNKGYSAINIGGLALGMAVTLLIGLWVVDELTHNSYFANKEKLHRSISHKLLTVELALALRYHGLWKKPYAMGMAIISSILSCRHGLMISI